jgi:hypothetical protein
MTDCSKLPVDSTIFPTQNEALTLHKELEEAVGPR